MLILFFRPEPQQGIIINGAATSVGAYAIQLAKQILSTDYSDPTSRFPQEGHYPRRRELSYRATYTSADLADHLE